MLPPWQAWLLGNKLFFFMVLVYRRPWFFFCLMKMVMMVIFHWIQFKEQVTMAVTSAKQARMALFLVLVCLLYTCLIATVRALYLMKLLLRYPRHSLDRNNKLFLNQIISFCCFILFSTITQGTWHYLNILIMSSVKYTNFNRNR